MGKLNRGRRTAVVGRHSGVNELTVHFIKKNEDVVSGSNKASGPPVHQMPTFLVEVVMVFCQDAEGFGCITGR